MKTASQLSLEIRRKKKAMQDNPDVVDLSGIPIDKQDEDIAEANEMTKELGLDKNHPKEHNEEPSAHAVLMADSEDRKHEAMAPDPKLDNMHMKRKERLAKMLRRR